MCGGVGGALRQWSWCLGGGEGEEEIPMNLEEVGKCGKQPFSSPLSSSSSFTPLPTPCPTFSPAEKGKKTHHRLHPQVREPRLNLSERSIIYVGCKVRDGCTGRGGGPQEGVFVRRVNGAFTGRVGRQASGCWSSNWVSTACPVLFFFF